jgi:transposase InsO family protein
MKDNIKTRLAKIYYDPAHPASFTTADALWKATQKTVPKAKVVQWLESQEPYTLHRPVRKHFSRNRYIVYNMDELWQADLNDMQSLQQENGGYRYLLTVIDVFSKYAWARPLYKKTGTAVASAFETIFQQSGRKPLKIQTDKGKEFTNSVFQAFLKKQQVHYYTTNNPDIKASVVERFNRTLKARMWRYFTYHSSYHYVDVLPQLLHAYNHSVHRSIKMAPANVNDNNVAMVWQTLYGTPSRVQSPKLKVGDTVRISREKMIFEKGYEKNWSEEIFKIVRVIKRKPIVYRLQDLEGESIEGTFYEKELQPVHIEPSTEFKIDKVLGSKGKGVSRKVLVSWKGYPSKFNSWILASQVVSAKK